MASASAPGKLLIAGEYAVLDGGTALVTAVAARARAFVTRTAGNKSTFEHPVTGRVLPFNADRARGLRWAGEDPGEWGEILAAVASTWWTNESQCDFLPSLAARVDTIAFYTEVAGERRKLGLGSSAAATVAFSAALTAALDESLSVADLVRFCRAAHARVQRGRGSGVDVLAAIHGGVIAGQVDVASCRRLSWPQGLVMVPVWSGIEANSVELIGRFEAYRQRGGDNYAQHIATLRQLSSAVDAAWQTGDVHRILAALSAYDVALARLDNDADIGIYTPIHDRLREIAGRAGTVYKVSGAGGGDFGLAFTDSERGAGAVREAFAAAGFTVLEAAVAVPGVRVERG